MDSFGSPLLYLPQVVRESNILFTILKCEASTMLIVGVRFLFPCWLYFLASRVCSCFMAVSPLPPSSEAAMADHVPFFASYFL
jgi:hypothetical protein